MTTDTVQIHDPQSALYDVAGARALDAAAVRDALIPSLTLMTRAGRAAHDFIRQRWHEAQRVVVVCGLGNNAGDGYVVARELCESGLTVSVVQVGDASRLSGDAKITYEALLEGGVNPRAELAPLAGADLIVDALLGIGVSREVEGLFADAIAAMNDAPAPVLALDVPSGLDPERGRVLGAAVQATATMTFIASKPGLHTGAGPDYAGTVVLDQLGVPAAVYESIDPVAQLITVNDVAGALAPRAATAHKGHHGHMLIVGGSPGFAGALQLAGEAAARVGAGLVSLFTPQEDDSSAGITCNPIRPELMVHSGGDSLLAMLAERADVVAVGPGLGHGAAASASFARIISGDYPLVVDADALRLLAAEPWQRDDWVLTPHPGEASALLDTTIAAVQDDRLAAARALVARYGGSVVLKGAGSVVSDGGRPAIVKHGNPGMGSGGMGDVLTGVIAGLIAQGFSPAVAARVGACIHSAAADRAARDGERGMLARDLMPHLRALVNQQSRLSPIP